MQAISNSRQLPISHLQEGPNPWRGRSLDTSDLEASLDRAPMLAPLIVRAVPGKRSRWEVIVGHRRLRAARKKGWSHVEVRIVAADDLLAEQLQLEENLRRQALKNEPAAMAHLLDLYKRLHPTRPGKNKSGQVGRLSALQVLARATGKSRREARRLAKIGNASAAVQNLYRDGKLNILQAEKIAGLSKDEQVRQLKLLKMPKTNEHLRALEALEYALKVFRGRRPTAAVRKKALGLVADLRLVLR